MAEEKAKKNTNKKTNHNSQNKSNNRKGSNNNRRRTNTSNSHKPRTNSSKKTVAKKTTPQVVEEKSKEVLTKVEEEVVKTPSKEIVQAKEIEETKKIEEEVEAPVKEEVTTPTPEEKLEKTLIFDGTQSKNLDDVVDKLEEDNIVLEDKVIKRSKTKKVIIIILIITMISIIALATSYVVCNEITDKTNQTINVNLYKKVSKVIKREGKLSSNPEPAELEESYEHIETITLANLEQKIMNREDMIVLIASTNCYHCATFEPIIEEVFAENNKTIYRLNVISLTDEEVDRFRSYYYFTKTPTIFRIKDGYVTAELLGSTTKDDLTNWVKLNS